jgi:transposase-like protein
MNAKTAVVYRAPNGSVRIDYAKGDAQKIAFWEPLAGGIVRTIFNSEGGITRREFFRSNYEMKEIIEHVNQFVEQEAIAELSVSPEFEPVKIKKKCPSCSSESLVIDLEAQDDKVNVPIMPLYRCDKCSGRSYYLTDEYLEYLVSNNISRFSKQEVTELSANSDAFKKELKEYIIRIFASKRIMCIR